MFFSQPSAGSLGQIETGVLFQSCCHPTLHSTS